MVEPLQITFQGMEPSPAVEQDIRRRASKLDRFRDHVLGCHVTVTAPHRHHRKGKPYDVHIDISVPGGELVVSREPGDVNAHDDVYVAVRDAFHAAGRQLEEFVEKQRESRSAPS